MGVIAKLYCWAKNNVLDERDAPDQVLLGAFDHRSCALCGLGMWLVEYHYMVCNPEDYEFIFGINEWSVYLIQEQCQLRIVVVELQQIKKIFTSDKESSNVFDNGKKGPTVCESILLPVQEAMDVIKMILMLVVHDGKGTKGSKMIMQMSPFLMWWMQR